MHAANRLLNNQKTPTVPLPINQSRRNIMKSKHSGFRRCVYGITFSILCLLVYSSSIGIAFGQKKPNVLSEDVNTDDKQFCGTSTATEFCTLYAAYNLTTASADAKKLARNEMIEVVRGQVDTYYKLRKDGRKTNIRWLQTLLDFLEIGTAGAIGIMNGERAKTVTGIALNIFQGGRTSFNKNFEILQTQVLINKMNANRAEIFTEIVGKKDLSSADYSWYAAKNDLRRYFFAGTFNNALDTLVDETGADVATAEEALRIVESQRIIGATTSQQLIASEKSKQALKELSTDLSSSTATTSAAALTTLQSIVTELNKDEKLKQLLESKNVSATSTGTAIVTALVQIRRDLTILGNDELVLKINNIIVKENDK